MSYIDIKLIPRISAGILFSATLSFGQVENSVDQEPPTQIEEQDLITLSGKIRAIKTKLCERNQGGSRVCFHLTVLTSQQKEIDLHLGAKDIVGKVVNQLAVNQILAFDAFRSQQMPENSYIAKTLSLDDRVIHLNNDVTTPNWFHSQDSEQKNNHEWQKPSKTN